VRSAGDDCDFAAEASSDGFARRGNHPRSRLRRMHCCVSSIACARGRTPARSPPADARTIIP
jgi:hypothetical protein